MIKFLMLALLLSQTAIANELICKNGYLIKCLEIEQPPPPEPEPKPNTIMLPIEVLGNLGTEKIVAVNVSDPQKVLKMAIMTNSLNYENKGAVKVNDENWIPLNHQTLTIEPRALARGGMQRGAPATFRALMPVKLTEKNNKISFKFNQTDGLSIGFRVIDFDLIDENGKSLLENQKEMIDPSTWKAPNGSDANRGKQLWNDANLISNNLKDPGKWFAHSLPASKPIKAKCADCHVKDGRDLKMFAYSNESIIERSKFHGLSEQDGKDIAAYIRGLDVSDKGRPWNPPYQPGPNINLDYWYAGVGIEGILDQDKDMLKYLFDPKAERITRTMVYDFMDNNKMVDTSTTPLAIQLPDWKQWLPIVHPKDAFKNNFYEGSDAKKEYDNITAYLNSRNDYPKDKLFHELHSFWLGSRRFFEIGSTNKNHWRTKDGDALKNLNGINRELAKTSLARLLAVKMFEIHHVYDLEMLGKKYINANENPRKNTWLARQYNVFEVPPHFNADNSDMFVGQKEKTGYFEATAWYQLQQVINPGIGTAREVVPVDYNYQPQFILKAAASSGIPEPIRFWYSQNVMFQTRVKTEKIPAGNKAGFNFRTMGPWTMLGTDNRNRTLGTNILKETASIQDRLDLYFMSANLRQFRKAMDLIENSLDTWPRRNSINSGEHRYLEAENIINEDNVKNINSVGPTRHYPQKIYYAIPRLIKAGAHCREVNYVIEWADRAWPNAGFKKSFWCGQRRPE